MVLILIYANSANALDDGDIATDVFTYTVSDGSLTDTATLTITIEGINDAPVAQDDYGFINENSTLDSTAMVTMQQQIQQQLIFVSQEHLPLALLLGDQYAQRI